MRAVFGYGHAAVADFEHVEIVPVAGAGEGSEVGVEVGDVDDAIVAAVAGLPLLLAFPSILNVAGGAPKIADAFGPKPWLVGAPLANAEDDGAAGGEQSLAHGGVGFFAIPRARIAPVILEVVDAPLRVLQRVLIFVTLAARAPGAGFGARVGIDAEFEAFRVDIISKCLDAGGEALRIGDDVAVGIARDLPAVVD